MTTQLTPGYGVRKSATAHQRGVNGPRTK